MANGSDIVQTIKVEVEGGDEAAAALEKIGESATSSFEDTQKAADTAGLSIEEFGKLSEKTQQAYVALSQRVQTESQGMVDATKSVQQAAEQSGKGTDSLGRGLDDVSRKSGLSRGEMRALGSVMKQLGVGEVAGLAFQFNKMQQAFGTIGVSILAAAFAFGALMKSIREAKEASDSVERLSKVLGDTPEKLKAMQAAFRAAGVSVADFEKAFDSMALKVIERSSMLAESTAQSSKKVIDAELAAVKAAQAASLRPELFDQQIKQLEASQKQEAAYLAEEQAAKAWANSQAALIPQLKAAAAGQKTVLDSGVKTESLLDALIQMFAEGGQAIGTFGDDLKAGAPKAEEMATKLNAMFNSFDRAAQAKMKAGLKTLIPESVINQITKTREQFEKLSQAPKLSIISPEAQDALVSFGNSIEDVKNQLAGFAGSAIAGIRDFDAWLRQMGQSAASAFAPVTEFFGRIPAAVDASIEQVKAAIETWVTTPVANAWAWIKETWEAIGTWIKEKADAAKQLVTEWVTTPISDAWGWLKSSFQAVLDWVAEKWAAFKQSLGLGGGSAAPAASGDGGGFAGGGLLGGRGSGTSDSNLAWVSRGEHIMPARAVSQPGVLAFLEALRRSGGNLRGVLDGMGRFALGGLVMPRLPAFAGGSGMNHVSIHFPGLPEITGLRASSAVVDELRHAAALAQVRSGGRKPSRYS